jgi:hypothetical protein
VPAGGAAVGVLVAVCRVSMAKEDGVREAWTMEAGKEVVRKWAQRLATAEVRLRRVRDEEVK